MKRFLLLVLLSACFTFSTAEAQLSSAGTDFFVAYLQPSISCSAIKPFQRAYVTVSAPYDCDVTISYFDDAGHEFQSAVFHIGAKQHLESIVDLSHMVSSYTDGEHAEYKAMHIHSSRTIFAHYYSSGPASAAMTMLLPTNVLGMHYVAASLPANPGLGAPSYRHFTCTTDSASSEFIIVGTVNGTHVTIIPNGSTLGSRRGVSTGNGADGTAHPFVVTLNRGQIYTIKSQKDDATIDESGSIVDADKPIAVFAGNENAYNGTANYSSPDQRNVLVQQMIPVEYWATSDYVSMPFVSSAPAIDGDLTAGDLFKIYTYDASAEASVQFMQSGASTVSASVLRYGPHAIENVTTGSTAFSTDGTPIMVEQYDYRQINGSDPATAPTMMNVVPLRDFVRLAMVNVPDEASEVHKKRYINVISTARDASQFQVWTNGVGPGSFSSFTAAGTSLIPGHPELTGRRYQVQPGTYLIRSDSAFAIYQYGYSGVDPDFDLGDLDDDDYYFEYASPSAQSFKATDQSAQATVTAILNCETWTVNASSSIALSEIQLLNDPLGVLKRKPGSDSGFVSSNLQFEGNDVVLPLASSSATATLTVSDPAKPADGYVRIVDMAGRDTLIHLTYTPLSITVTPINIEFLGVSTAGDSCATFVIHNTAALGGRMLAIDSVTLIAGSRGFRIPPQSGTHRTLQPGDSDEITVCFKPAEVGKLYYDTLVLHSECSKYIVLMTGAGVFGLLQAPDLAFDGVRVGDTAYRTLAIKNVGSADVTISQFAQSDPIHFKLYATPPVVIPAHKEADIQVAYLPMFPEADSSRIEWVRSDGSTSIKAYSILRGKGLTADIEWIKAVDWLATQQDSVKKEQLVNRSSIEFGNAGLVDSVFLEGPDAKEFALLENAFGYDPLGTFALRPADSMWIEVAFRPDTTLTRTRHASLVAHVHGEATPRRVELIGEIGRLGVQSHGLGEEVRLIPNPAYGAELGIELPQAQAHGATIEIFDALGRSCVVAHSSGTFERIDISSLVAGIYFVRISNGPTTVTKVLEVDR